MNFNLTEDQRDLQALFREFTDKEIRPRAQKMDETNELDEELWQKMADLGSFGILIPEEYGGVGLGLMEMMLVIEEVVKGSGTIYNWIGTGNGPCSSGILKFGTEEQKHRYIPAVATGQVKGAFALTEPGAGSDASGLKTKAVVDGDHFIINGSKTFCTMGSKAENIFTIARIIEKGEDKGFGAILVPRLSTGLATSDEHKMGQLGTPVNEIAYQDVVVPVENLVGKVGDGMKVAMSCLNEIRTACGALAVGLAQEAIDEAVKYSKERMQFGKRVSEFQNTQFVLAECQTRVQAARLLVYQSAATLDEGRVDRALHSMCKYYAGEVCNDVVRKCLQVFGGYGYIKDYPIERIYRDAKITEIFDGTAEIHKVIISKMMGVR